MRATQFLALVRRDLLLFFGDRRSVVMSFVAPIVIASFFGYVFGGGGGSSEPSRIPVLVADEDGGAFSGEVIRQLERDGSLEVKRTDAAQARSAVRRGKATAAVILPKSLGPDIGRAAMAGGPKPEISIPFDPGHQMEMRMVQGAVTGAVMEAAARILQGEGSRAPKSREDLMPFRMAPQEMVSQRAGSYNAYSHSFGGMGIQFLLMVGAEVGIAMLARKQQGTWARLRAAPVSRGVVLASRVVSSAATSFLTLVVLFAFAWIVFGARINGSLAGFAAVCLAFSLLTGTVGLLIAAFGKTPDVARSLAILITLVMVMLGGAWVPTIFFPKWLQSLTVAIPTRWAMDGLDAVTWRGLGFSAVLGPVSLLLLGAATLGALAWWRFRWEAE